MSKYTRQDVQKIVITVYLMDERYEEHTERYNGEMISKHLAEKYNGTKVSYTTDIASLIVPNKTGGDNES